MIASGSYRAHTNHVFMAVCNWKQIDIIIITFFIHLKLDLLFSGHSFWNYFIHQMIEKVDNTLQLPNIEWQWQSCWLNITNVIQNSFFLLTLCWLKRITLIKFRNWRNFCAYIAFSQLSWAGCFSNNKNFLETSITWKEFCNSLLFTIFTISVLLMRILAYL